MSLFQRLLDTFRTGRLHRELDEEMRFHIDMRTEAYERQGLPRDEAHARALRRFGSPLNARERVRDVHVLAWLDSVRQDVVLGLRLLRRSPALALAAALSLALAIGATTGVFAVWDRLLMRPLPVSRPADLIVPQWHAAEWPDMSIWGSLDEQDNSWSFSYPMYEDFRKVPGIDVAAFQNVHQAVTDVRGEAGTADGGFVTGGFFRVLGVAPAAGRLLGDLDDRPDAEAVVVLSYRYWQRAFGGDAGAIGSAMVINGRSYTVVGVAPPPFFGMQPGLWMDFYVPARWIATLSQFSDRSMLTNERYWWVQLVARPKPGANPAALQAALATRFANRVKPLVKTPKQNPSFTFRSGERGYAFLNDESARAIRILAALVGLVLLIACSNVANLLLSRAESRRREAALRMALGARSPRLVRQHLTESLTLALLSGAAGLVFAQWFAAGVLSLAPQGDAPVIDLRFDLPVVAFGLALSVAAGLLVGLVPAWTLSRSAVRTALAAGVTVKRGWARRVGVGRPLVAAQIALSLVLLVVAGLLVRSLANLQSAQIGFASKGLVLFDLDATAAGYAPQQRNAATERIAASLRQLPHVGSVSWSSFALLNGLTWNTGITVERETKTRPGACNLLWIAPGYHRTLKIPVLAGRTIDERDRPGTTRVAVVNQAFARKYFGGGSVLGHVVTFEDDPEPLRVEIVGLVGDTMYSRIRRGVEPIAFLADAQRALPIGPSFVLAYEGDQATLARDVTRLVHQLEPALPVMRLRSYHEQVARQLTMERSLSLAASAFGVVALLLAAIGLYGVVAFAVARRTSELGVRLALGATRRGVLRLVLTDSAKVIVPGACIGVAAALAATRLVKVVLYGLTPTDAGTMALAVALLLAVSAVAAFLPARRAAAIDPAEALRCE